VTGRTPDRPADREAPAPARAGIGDRVLRWLDERTGLARIARVGLRKVFPDHWSFLLGEIALFCFVILVATGTFLTFFYVPSAAPVTYEGGYEPLRGEEVSAAFESVLHLTFEVTAGLLMRQIHHWAALVFVGVIVLHLARVFFTGAFRRPRELNWIVGFVLLTLALAEGFTGYSLPDDLLSGTGARIAYSAALAIPFLGPYLASLVFGGEFPTEALISRFFVIHVMLLPGLFIGAIAVHLAMLVLHKHTQYPGGPAREGNVVGRYFWPGQVFLSTGLFFLTAAVVAFLGGFFQINPIWVYGPFDAAVVSSPAQPDWYVGWLDGALRIFPPFEPTILGVTLPSAFIPGVVIPGFLFTVVALWPFIEARLSGDRAEHHLLDRLSDHPVRTATGVTILAIFGILTLAGGNDVLAFYFGTELETLTLLFRVLTLVVPPLLWVGTYRLMLGARGGRDATGRTRAAAGAGGPAGLGAGAGTDDPVGRRGATRPEGAGGSSGDHSGVVVRRTPEGGFEEVGP
jgi:ubiquinol-cytochrome c reductase cytochrome b subunit